jgi:hypothetical protein
MSRHWLVWTTSFPAPWSAREIDGVLATDWTSAISAAYSRFMPMRARCRKFTAGR